MAVELEKLEGMLASAVHYAANWAQEGNDDMEQLCTPGAIEGHLHIALVKFSNAEAGIEYLLRSNLSHLLQRHVDLNRVWKAKVGVDVGSSSTDRLLVHVAWLVDCPAQGRELIAELRSPGNIKVNGKSASAKYWNEYDASLEALALGCSHEPNFGRLSGLLRHWAAYPKLISAITNRRSFTEELEEIHSFFRDRHRDKRPAMTLTDGHPSHPVNWDFREASILRFANRAGLL